MRQESKYIEYKETVTKTFLKVVSAFANYNDGKIIFGICDDGSIKGLENPHKAAIDIENAINDSISPVPEYDITVNEHNKTVILNILRGSETLTLTFLLFLSAFRKASRVPSPPSAKGNTETSASIPEASIPAFTAFPASSDDRHPLNESIRTVIFMLRHTIPTHDIIFGRSVDR